MTPNLQNLEPHRLWTHFSALSQIPRISQHEQAAIAFVKSFAESLGLEHEVDEPGNIIVRKAASPRKEHLEGVILQGHIDMVPQQRAGVEHDFLKAPISFFRNDEWIKAHGTTLGADNGIGVAAAMAVLESEKIMHGPLEVLVTVNEEAGMTGALGLSAGKLQGGILLNLDSEDEGALYIGCAGGVDIDAVFEVHKERLEGDARAFRLGITGLRGGHSGLDINLDRGNACLLLAGLLLEMSERFALRIASIDAGSLRNAIPRDSSVTFVVNPDRTKVLETFIAEQSDKMQHRLWECEPGLRVQLESCPVPEEVFPLPVQRSLLEAVTACPNGVIAEDISLGVVETSSNLALVKNEGRQIKVSCLARSADNEARDAVAAEIARLFMAHGASAEISGAYPGWRPNSDSRILRLMQQQYRKRFGRVPDVKVIHAGLECGILGEKYPHWEMISFGPTIHNPHSPDEKVHIASVARFWDFLVTTLENIPEKQGLGPD